MHANRNAAVVFEQVLVVHLLRFKYEETRSVKVACDVDFHSELKLLPNMFADGAPAKHASYCLFATINHIGAPLRAFAASTAG
jgi:hypothetical protein